MEKWKDVKGYEGLYQVSNLGRVKSLPKKLWNGRGYYTRKEKILKQLKSQSGNGYYFVQLYKNKKGKPTSVHKLVAIAFLNHEPNGYELVVDHIDNDKFNNKADNLQLITARQNSSKDSRGTSKYVGVTWHSRDKRWQSSIKIDGRSVYLGSFKCELKAAEAYNNKLKEIEDAKN